MILLYFKSAFYSSPKSNSLNWASSFGVYKFTKAGEGLKSIASNSSSCFIGVTGSFINPVYYSILS
jgi:hypothetical protein